MAKKAELDKELQAIVEHAERTQKMWERFAMAVLYRPTKQQRNIEHDMFDCAVQLSKFGNRGHDLYIVQTCAKEDDPSTVQFKNNEVPEGAIVVEDFDPNKHLQQQTTEEVSE